MCATDSKFFAGIDRRTARTRRRRTAASHRAAWGGGLFRV